ncbi:IS982 family transposase, partial [Streptomyces sp. NPDC005125]
MTNDVNTLATALYARIDDELKASPWLAPWRPKVGITPTLSDAELLTLAVMSALLGYTSERRWLRRVDRDFRGLFPYVPQQSGYGKRLRAASSLLTSMIRILARDTSLWSDDVWLVDSTPVGCGCSRETAKRSDLAGWAQYGYCASHSRYFWGLRLHLVCTLGG